MELPIYSALGYAPISPVFVDTTQGIRGQFCTARTPSFPQLELLEQLEPSGPLSTCLRNGIKMYHMAFASTDIESDAHLMAREGAKIIQPVHDAVYFENVCFLMLRNRQLIELVTVA